MKRLRLFTLILTAVITAVMDSYGQSFAGASFVQGPERMEILQVENRDYSTLVYIAYTTPSAKEWHIGDYICFGDNTYAAIKGDSKRYKLISTINMPISSEAEKRWVMFDHSSQRHQFILEFEKLPENIPFEIIEDLDNPHAFNFSEIIYTPTDSASYIYIDDFIADYPVKEYGQYAVDGNIVHYVKHKGITITVVPQLLDQYGKYFNMNLWIQNLSDRSVLFNPANVFMEGYVYNKKKVKGKELITPEKIDMKVLSHSEFDKIVKNKQRWDSFWAALGEGLAAYGAGYSSSSSNYTETSIGNASVRATGYVGNTYGYAQAYGSSYTTTYGKTKTWSYNGGDAYAASQNARSNIANYTADQRSIRQQLGDGYLKLNTLPSQAQLSGYLNVKYQELDKLSMKIIIGGEVFPFIF